MSMSLKAAQAQRQSHGIQRGGYARGMSRGDPGVGSFLKKAAGAIIGGTVGLVTGGPGAAVRNVAQSITGTTQAPMRGIPMVSGMPGSGTQVAQIPTPGARGALQRLLPGGATGFEAAPSGYHANRASYFLKDGTFVERGSRWVKNRSRNAMNPRALKRAVARVEAGKIWQGKLHEIETGKYTKAGNRKS